MKLKYEYEMKILQRRAVVLDENVPKEAHRSTDNPVRRMHEDTGRPCTRPSAGAPLRRHSRSILPSVLIDPRHSLCVAPHVPIPRRR